MLHIYITCNAFNATLARFDNHKLLQRYPVQSHKITKKIHWSTREMTGLV